MNDRRTIVVVGGGLGGLAAAAVLAHRGCSVTLLEQASTLGGKLQSVSLGGQTFDFGPSTITMPWMFERVFALCEQPLDDALQFVRLPIHSRNWFADGSMIECLDDPETWEHSLSSCTQEDRAGWKQMLEACRRFHHLAEAHFFGRSFAHWSHFVSPALVGAMARVRPWESMASFHRRFVRDERLLAMMNRYATYVGSHPRWTPATLSMIAHVEWVTGVYWVRGGNYTLVEALARLARSRGVRIATGQRVDRLVHRHRRVEGVVTTDGTTYEADVVVANVDDALVQQWIDPKTAGRPTADACSLSGIVTLVATSKRWEALTHHNLFYGNRPEQEFVDIFERRQWPSDPAIYVCFSGATEPDRAPNGSNLYVMTNVPALTDDQLRYPERVRQQAIDTHQAVLERLETQWGLDRLRDHIIDQRTYSPIDIAHNTGSHRGALYGLSSHGHQMFLRPPIKKRALQGLFACGGSVHPGGGTPMVVLSGMLAADAVSQDLRLR